MKKKYLCPNCKKVSSLDSSNSWRPFCSERCRLIDLGEWIEEKNKIATSDSVDFFESMDLEDELRH